MTYKLIEQAEELLKNNDIVVIMTDDLIEYKRDGINMIKYRTVKNVNFYVPNETEAVFIGNSD